MKLEKVISSKSRENSYLISFSDEANFIEFEMWVEGVEILVVMCDDAFYEYVHYNTISLGPIFEAILSFHHARAVPFPPQAPPGGTPPCQAEDV